MRNLVIIIIYIFLDVSKYLSESTKEKFLENVKRDQPNDKIKGLLDKTTDFIDEMMPKMVRWCLLSIVNINIYFTELYVSWVGKVLSLGGLMPSCELIFAISTC